MIRALFGADFFDRNTGNAIQHYADPEVRAVKVIGQLLSATRFDEFGDFVAQRRTAEAALAWADELWKLAQAVPDSSYAPYAAYYAAGCYAGVAVSHAVETVRSAREPGKHKDRMAEAEHRASLLAEDELTSKAEAAFTFAAERADAYVKPRVLLLAGMLKAFQFQQEEASRLWNEALQAAPGNPVITKPIESMRRELEKLKPQGQ